MKQLTRKEKKRIIRKVNTGGKSVGDMAKEYGRSRRTIDRIVKRGSLDRVSKVDKDVKKEIMRLVTEKPGITSEEIRTLLKVKISTSSVNKCLARCGFVCQSTKVPVRERTCDAMRLPEKKEKSTKHGEEQRREYRLDDKTKEEIMDLVTENPLITAKLIQTGIGKHLAISTINGFLSKNGLKSACRKIPNRGKESIVTLSCGLNEDM